MITLSQRREVGEFRKRYRWMALFVLLVFMLLVARVAQVQLFQRDRWSGIAQQNITKTLELPATRGVIRDVSGRVVASNRPSYDVYATPGLLEPEDLGKIASLMGLSEREREAFENKIASLPDSRRNHQIELFSDIDRDQLAALETHLAELPALDIVTVPLRDYPYGTLGAHLIGYLNEVNASDIEAAADPEAFWAGFAEQLEWIEPWKAVREGDPVGRQDGIAKRLAKIGKKTRE